MAESANTPSLLDRLTDSRGLPARADERHETGVVEQRGTEDRGRSPEDVVGDLAERQAPVQTREGDDQPILKQKHKVKVDGVDSELSLEEIAKRGLLEKVFATAEQFPHLQKKYQDTLEKIADKDLSKPTVEETKPAPVQITQEMITRTFMPAAQEYVAKGFIEPDFLEAYPAFVTNAMYLNARVVDAENVILKQGKIIDNLVAWIKAEIDGRKVKEYVSEFDKSIDTVAAKADGEKGEKVFARLKEPEERKKFVDWLRDYIDPKSSANTPEHIQTFWMAYIGNDLLKYAREAADKTEPKKDKRRATGDGNGARAGAPVTTEKTSLLDRMTDNRLQMSE